MRIGSFSAPGPFLPQYQTFLIELDGLVGDLQRSEGYCSSNIEFILYAPTDVLCSQPQFAKAFNIGASLGERQAQHAVHGPVIHADQRNEVPLITEAAPFGEAERLLAKEDR